MTEQKTTSEENRSVFYSTKKGFANVFVYDEDMLELGYSKEEVEKMTNGDINSIFREKLGLKQKVRASSGTLTQLKEQLGLSKEATQAEVNKAILEKMNKKK